MTKRMTKVAMAAVLAGVAGSMVAMGAAAADKPLKGPMIDKGRYLVMVAGCNDCHTPGYGASDGKVPEKDWLTGDALGWKGPWGTTYPTNLRNYFDKMTEKQWLDKAKTLKARPPMPAMNVRAMTKNDLRSIYRYVKAMGPAGKEAPAFVPPGQEPQGPVVQFPMPPK